jgi:hypothetical protein
MNSIESAVTVTRAFAASAAAMNASVSDPSILRKCTTDPTEVWARSFFGGEDRFFAEDPAFFFAAFFAI